MKGLVIFTAVVTVTSAQVLFPGASGGSDNSKDVDSQVHSALISLDRNIPSQSTNDDSCILPNGSKGNCFAFSECSAYSHFAANIRNASVLNFLRARVCRLLQNKAYICCPVGNAASGNLQIGPSGSQNAKFPKECGKAPLVNRIIEGKEIEVGAYPWLVAIGRPEGNKFNVNCGGSLITQRHVITASHCFRENARRSNPSHARVGEHNVESNDDNANPKSYNIIRFVSAGYNKITKQNDITLVTLDEDVSFNTYIQPICLPFRSDLKDKKYVGHRLDIVGWGFIDYNTAKKSPVPLEAKVEVVTLESCQQAYYEFQTPVTDRQLCAGTGVSDTCTGDSGGPLNYLDPNGRFYLAGVTSYGFECGNASFPGVYVRVGSYLNWIETNIN